MGNQTFAESEYFSHSNNSRKLTFELLPLKETIFSCSAVLQARGPGIQCKSLTDNHRERITNLLQTEISPERLEVSAAGQRSWDPVAVSTRHPQRGDHKHYCSYYY